VLGWLAVETQRSPDIGLLLGKRRATLAYYQQSFIEALEESGRYLSDDNIERISLACDRLLETYVAFCEEAKAAQVRGWKLVRKVHPLIHLMEDMRADRLNCRFFSGWTDETLMGKVITMVQDQDSRKGLWNALVAYWPMFIERSRAF
jgi:hypothetical protein